MTAHCHIAQVLPDGQIRAIYVHHAEATALIGLLLAQCYPDGAAVAELLDLGDLSSLGTTPLRCAAYGRDGRETGTDARVYPDIPTLIDAALGTSVIYLFRDDQWFVRLTDGNLYPLKPNGYVAWHGPVVPLLEAVIRAALALQRPFEQDEVLMPMWGAGYSMMLHLDDRFQIYRDAHYTPRLWIVKPVPLALSA